MRNFDFEDDYSAKSSARKCNFILVFYCPSVERLKSYFLCRYSTWSARNCNSIGTALKSDRDDEPPKSVASLNLAPVCKFLHFFSNCCCNNICDLEVKCSCGRIFRKPSICRMRMSLLMAAAKNIFPLIASSRETFFDAISVENRYEITRLIVSNLILPRSTSSSMRM